MNTNKKSGQSAKASRSASTCSVPLFDFDRMANVVLSKEETERFKRDSEKVVRVDPETNKEVTFYVKKDGSMMLGGIKNQTKRKCGMVSRSSYSFFMPECVGGAIHGKKGCTC